MPRPLRIEYPGAWYHVMNRGLEGREIFARPGDGRQFLTLLAEACSLFEAECHAYCLMPNHYHLLLHTPQGNLSQLMKRLSGIYTQRFNLGHERDGPLFRGRYKATLVDADNYLLQVSRYIHRNPLAAGLISQAENYRWSSYRSYLTPSGAPDWLHREMLLEMAGGPDAYRDYVETHSDREIDAFYDADHPPPVPDGSEGRRPGIDGIMRMVAEAYEIPPEELTGVHRGHIGEARALAMTLCRNPGNHPLTDVAEAFGRSPAAISKAVAQTRGRMADNTAFARRFADLEAKVK